MIAALLLSVALAGEPPPCTHYKIISAVPGAIRRDTVDAFLCHVYVVDSKGDTLIKADEYTNTTPEVYDLGRKVDKANAQVKQLDSLAELLRAKDKKK